MSDQPEVVTGTVLLHPVESSAIHSIGYNHECHFLLVVFHHNKYIANAFFDVPVEVYQDFMKAESKGKYFNTYVRGLYDSQKVAIQAGRPPWEADN